MRFFGENAYRAWRGWNERAVGNIRGDIKVSLDLKQPDEFNNDNDLPMSTQAKGKRKREALGKGGIEGLEVGYSDLKNHMEKSIFTLAEGEGISCALCAKKLGPKTAMALVCPQQDCRTATHVACLATKFIEDEGAGTSVTPTCGRCPGCKEEIQWIDLVKELSLRLRGEKELARIMKKPKECKTKVPRVDVVVAAQPEAPTFEEEEVVADLDEDPVGVEMRSLDGSDGSLLDEWQYQCEDDDDMTSVMSGHSALSGGVEVASPTKCSSSALKLPAMIEDSELDDTEFSD